MIIRFKNLSYFLYIFFTFLSLNIFFFSTDKVEAKSFDVNNIEISKPFEINFDKNKVIAVSYTHLTLPTTNSV